MDVTTPNVERLLAAFQKKQHDRVPNFEVLVDPAMMRHIMGWSDVLDRGKNSGSLSAAEAVEYAKRTCQDAIPCWTSAGLSKHWGTICSWEDIEKIAPPDPNKFREKVESYLAAVAGTNIGVWVTINCPFHRTFMAVGPVPIQSFMLKVYDDLPFVEHLMDLGQQYQIEILEAIADLPVSFVYMDDDVCTSSGYFISPRMMDSIWVPRAERLVGLVKRMGVPIIWHCCGKLDPVLPLLAKWGVAAIHPVQPSCNDIYAIKREWGEHLCLIGNMNIEGVLAFGSPTEVIADTKEHIDRLSYNGGYVVASSHSIVDSIPPENYFAMIHAAQEYGRF
jgi:uroporphyrinogen decarboxylase